MKPETLAVHAGRSHDLNAGAVAPPLVLSSTFERGADGGYPHGHVYSRTSNPNREALERSLAALEGGAAAVAYGSGTAAVMAVMMALEPGDHVIIPADLYWGTAVTMREMMARWNLSHSMVDHTDYEAVQKAWQPNTKLLWLETPSNPMLKVIEPDQKISDDDTAAFEQRIILDRNKVMAERAVPILDKGNVFIAVGALHLVGDQGLVALLRQQGFTVTAAN